MLARTKAANAGLGAYPVQVYSWLIKRRLRKAARLQRQDKLSEGEFGAYAVYAAECLRVGGRLRIRDLEGRSYNWVRFPIEASVLLKRRGEEWPNIDFQGSLDEFGPFDHATIWIAKAIERMPDYERDGQNGFVWTPSAERLLRDACFRLSWTHRQAEDLERWVEDRRTRLPSLSSTAAKVMVALVSGLILFLLGGALTR